MGYKYFSSAGNFSSGRLNWAEEKNGQTATMKATDFT
jgi:hypothetical protein